MKYRKIPGTDLKVSEIGFGIWKRGAEIQKSGRQKAQQLLKYALDRGINFFDTADIDGEGQCETLLGEALEDERDRVVIATKFGYDLHHAGKDQKDLQGIPQDFSPKFVRSACEESLKRLRTDHIDLYQMHHPKISTIERDDLYQTLAKLKQQGKIITWGAALGPSNEWLEEGKLLMRLRKSPAFQMKYDLLNQEPGRELMRDAKNSKTGIFVQLNQVSRWTGYSAEKISKLEFMIHPKQRSLIQATIRFILSKPAVCSVLPEMSDERSVNEFAVAGECPGFSEHEISRVENLYDNEFQENVSPREKREDVSPRTDLRY